MQETAAQTQGKFRIGPTSLYRSIKQMLEAGLIVETDEHPDPELDDERRRYYRLTSFGKRVVLAEIRRFERERWLAQSLPGLTRWQPQLSAEGTV